MNTPTPTFKMRMVSPHYPNELHETIVVTPELVEWATAKKPAVEAALINAQHAERSALATSRGEASWRSAGGPRKAINADHCARMATMFSLLAAGKYNGGSAGWIDRREWLLMVDHATALS